MSKYLDKNGEIIKAGMTIQHDDGSKEKVIAINTQYGEDLGLFCSKYEAYPLSEFDIEKEWTIVKEENQMNAQEILNLLGKKAYIVVKDENGEAQKEFEEFFYKNALDEKDNQSITEEEKNQFTFYKHHIIGEATIRKIEFDNEPKLDDFNLKTYIITYFIYYGRYGKTRKHNIVELNELNKIWFLSKDDAINYIDEIANDRVIV